MNLAANIAKNTKIKLFSHPPNLIIFVALNEAKHKEISKEIKEKNNSPLETFFWYKSTFFDLP